MLFHCEVENVFHRTTTTTRHGDWSKIALAIAQRRQHGVVGGKCIDMLRRRKCNCESRDFALRHGGVICGGSAGPPRCRCIYKSVSRAAAVITAEFGHKLNKLQLVRPHNPQNLTIFHVFFAFIIFTWLLLYRTVVFKQEAQLMLTTGSTRLAVSRGQQTWYHFGSIATFR